VLFCDSSELDVELNEFCGSSELDVKLNEIYRDKSGKVQVERCWGIEFCRISSNEKRKLSIYSIAHNISVTGL